MRATDLVTNEMVREYAAKESVCVRPVLRQVTDRDTGEVHKLVIPCGSTREAKCPPCAAKAQRLRMQQCREGWHLEHDPLDDQTDDTDERQEPDEPDDAGQADDRAGEQEQGARRIRSTRRRADTAELPRAPAERRSVGRTFTAPDGAIYRPSMFVTLTLGSYGPIIPGTGVPAHPESYEYRRAAAEALHFSKAFDRWMQNLRRCAGYRVQYFGAVEAQRRLAPHLHLALRGAIPRQVLRQVTRATYLHLWWPSFEDPKYTQREPVWDPHDQTYRCPYLGFALPTWQEALDELDNDPDARPAFVMRFGTQVDVKGIIAPSEDANRSIRYLAKYLTKAVAETYTDPDHCQVDPAYEAHIDRLHAQVLLLPCSPECANWLRYGVQPKDAGPGMLPGWCPMKAHDRENLGFGGRRVQVSRHWSGKTLSEHRADRAEVVRQVLAAAGIEPPEADRLSTSVLSEDGKPRFVWEDLPVDEHDYVDVVMATVSEARRWRAEYENAKHLAESRASPDDSNSATTRPRPPDSQPNQVA